jgi:hypothetical protein
MRRLSPCGFEFIVGAGLKPAFLLHVAGSREFLDEFIQQHRLLLGRAQVA